MREWRHVKGSFVCVLYGSQVAYKWRGGPGASVTDERRCLSSFVFFFLLRLFVLLSERRALWVWTSLDGVTLLLNGSKRCGGAIQVFSCGTPVMAAVAIQMFFFRWRDIMYRLYAEVQNILMTSKKTKRSTLRFFRKCLSEVSKNHLL